MTCFHFGERQVFSRGHDRYHAAHQCALRLEWRNEAADHHKAGLDEQLRDLTHAADVFDAIRFGEAEVAIKSVTDIVAIEHDARSRARYAELRKRGHSHGRNPGGQTRLLPETAVP